MNKAKSVYIVISVIIAAASLMFGGLYYHEIQKQKTVKTGKKSEKPASSETDTSNWKTYRSEKYGFEVKYPDRLKIMSTEGSFPHDWNEKVSGIKLYHVMPTGKTEKDTCYGEYSGIPEPCKRQIEDTNFGFFRVNKKYEDLASSIYRSLTLGEIIIDGKKGLVTEVGVEGDGEFYYLVPITNSQTLIISRVYNNEFDKKFHGDYNQALFNQILSTFKFIE